MTQQEIEKLDAALQRIGGLFKEATDRLLALKQDTRKLEAKVDDLYA